MDRRYIEPYNDLRIIQKLEAGEIHLHFFDHLSLFELDCTKVSVFRYVV
jgi:hypothetical protein